MHLGHDKGLIFKILPMTEEDIAEVLRIEDVSFPRPWIKEFFVNELSNPVSHAFVGKVKEDSTERLGAYIVFWIVSDESHILNIAVEPELRLCGLATKLLVFSLDLMEEKGVKEVYLEVRRKNMAARGLYKKFGFVELVVREKYYGDEDAIVMRLVMRERKS